MESHGRSVAVMWFTRFTAHLFLLIMVFHEASYAEGKYSRVCPPSSCGGVHNISYPFRLASDRENCWDSMFELVCENNITVLYLLRDGYNYYHVKEINYNNYTIRVAAPNVLKGNCSTVPMYPLFKGWVTDLDFQTEIRYANTRTSRETRVKQLTQTVTFLSCGKPVTELKHPSYIDATSCLKNSGLYGSRRNNTHYYVVVGDELRFADLEESCRIDLVTLIAARKGNVSKRAVSSYREIHDELAYGFELSWWMGYCNEYGEVCDECYVDEDFNNIYCPYRYVNPDPYTWKYDGFQDFLDHVGNLLESLRVCIEILAAPRMLCVLLVIALLTYKWRSRHLSVYDGIEEFLQSNNNLMPIRYSYWEIIKMTNGFRDKLGEGGFGCVYKGKLSSGQLVAIKMLGKSKSNGQDFINEVATIGRIHHVNVVQLIGFCVSGSKRALVYNFMPNGSLDKYIFRREGVSNSLSYSKIFDVAIGVARGMEYLHRGCDMQILHFDIKPHNILLDDNFVPKVSDFGLARLCPLNNSVVSLTAVRGTMGYMAPELFYKNIGGVSHKADVYSFGMLLMEMANKRKNVNAKAENSSQIYFPLWIYDQFSKGKEVEIIENATEEESVEIRKMILVALWCIQLKPCDRPSMNGVIEMLEGGIETLQMPPKPCLYPQEHEQELHSSGSSTPSEEDSAETGLISDA